MPRKDICVFFDIDGTLVDTHGAGRDAFRRAVCEALDICDNLEHISFAGATDLDVFCSLCNKHGCTPAPEAQQHFFYLLEQYLQKALHHDNMTLLPNTIPLLNTLYGEARLDLGLLTGNAENCARIKLEPFGLNRFFEFGAFGNEFAIRNDIARQARRRAIERSGNANLRLVVIGDTPLDILAAQAIDATSIAVATGRYSFDELIAAEADHVLPDLTDTGKLLKLIVE